MKIIFAILPIVRLTLIFLFLACDKAVYTDPSGSGRIVYPRLPSQMQEIFDENGESSTVYLPSLSCYFKVLVSPGKRVRVKFDSFDLQDGVDKGIILNSAGKIIMS